MYADHKEMTNPEFKEIKEDLLTNRIERIFAGTLHESHKTDFQNNRKIMKDAKTPGRYDFEIAFNKNDGKQQNIVLPFTVTTTTDGTNTRKYTFENKGKVVNIDNISYDISTT